MRRIVLWICACIAPLAWLTASSFPGLFTSMGSVRGWQSIDSSQELKLATETVQGAGPSKEFIAKLADTDSFGKDIPDLAKRATGKKWTEVGQRWASLEALALLMTEMPQPNTQYPLTEQKAWEKYLTKHSGLMRGLPKGETVFSSVSQRIEAKKGETKKQEERIETEEKTDQVLEEAEKAFAIGNFEGAYQILSRVPQNSLGLLDAKRVKRMTLVRRHVEFRRDLARAQSEVEPSTRLRELKKFLERFSEPPTEAERGRYEECQQKAKDLEGEIALERLRTSPPATVREYLNQARRVLATGAGDPIRDDLKTAIKRWLDALIEAKPTTEFDSIFEVEAKSGTLLTGVFVKVGESPVRYNFYKTRAERDVGVSYRELLLGDLRGEPKKCVHLRCAETYGTQRQRLLQRLDSRAEWEKLAEVCDKLEEEIGDYENRTRSERKGKLSFKKEADFARDVLKEWPALEALLRGRGA